MTARAPFDYFVILGEMRTGSNLLESHLNEYKDLECHGELFNPHFVGYPIEDSIFTLSVTERDKNPLALLQNLIDVAPDGVPGFRLFSDDDHRVRAACLADPACGKVILTRNPLDSFISFEIAEAVDQWKLMALHKRRKKQIEFDMERFAAFLDKRQKTMAEIEHGLQQAGQTAFRIDYSVINQLDVINGLANYLGSNHQRKKLTQKMARQNPEPLSQKVTNYDQMMAEVKSLPIFEPAILPYLPTKEFSNIDAVWTRDDPCELYVPISKFRSAGIADGMIKTAVEDLPDWLNKNPKRHSFTVMDHPVERAYDAFMKHIFTTDDNLFHWVRRNLCEFHGAILPDEELCKNPDRTQLENACYSAQQHGDAFVKFLEYLKANLDGLTRARIDRSWVTQSTALQDVSKWVAVDKLLKPKNAKALGLLGAQQTYVFQIEHIYSETIEAATRAAYHVDYQKFGFSNWEPV